MTFIDEQGYLDCQDHSGRTVLMKACIAEDKQIVLDLISKANLNIQDTCGYTALMLAAERGLMSISTALVENGADPTIKNKLGKTAIELAIGAGYLRTAHIIDLAHQALTGSS